MRKILLFLFPLFIQGQNVEIGNWKDYQSYNSASYICETKDKIYCVNSGSLFYVRKDDYTINRMSKINGLSDFRITKIDYSYSLDITIITYENCNIDLLINNSVFNLSDIKRKEIPGIKTINNITIKDGIAYLSCSFGLVLVDLEKQEIKETYIIEKNGSIAEINDCAVDSNVKILIATSAGLYVGNISSTLNNPNNWLLYGAEMNAINVIRNNNIGCVLYTNDDESYLDIFYPSLFDVPLFIDTGLKEIIWTNNLLHKTYDNKLILSSDGVNILKKIEDEKIINNNYAISDSENNIWIADSKNGLLRFINHEYDEEFSPEGPKINNIYSLEYLEDKLYMCHGGHANFGINSLINDGVSIKNSFDEWKNYDRDALGNARDILEVAVNNGSEYYASWYHGIPKIQNGEFIIKYGFSNTNSVLDTTWYSNNRIRISDLKFDKKGNLWGLSSEVNHPLFVKTKDDDWYSFSMNQGVVDLFFDDLLIDSWGQKWGIIGREGGLFVYNDNNTIENPYDDQFNILTTNTGDGNLPSQAVYSIVEDLERTIWIGTDKGIGVIYNPSNVFSGNTFDAQQILIQEGEYGQYLLSEEKVKCIAVDGANRKWIGTENSGIFLLSEDGVNQIHHFTSKNSPLFSDNIIDIAINHTSGEVFIGTSNGLLSFRSDATKGEESQSTTHVFPNPVRETYFGPIAISGLIKNANIKITDIDGNLVFEDYANGGQAIWNGKNKNNQRVSTGVYLVFSTDINGKEKMTSKILFIK